ncbi:nucleoside phosphorylase [Magnetospirillum sp. ME-1]|uniref:phosphorylase family protein n=1 Tax=Magnetospirillum sp. ME-1 TaxID=1639348 RepID=UPI000A17EA26|nr:nucleoside phosphorylase [Magnetospirillum sp. ME-1]ARJ67364.1 nucleoside phosphorylase [Magnetospirillum sp. ME-1]
MPSDHAFPESCWGPGLGKGARVGVIVGMTSEGALLPAGTHWAAAGGVTKRVSELAEKLLAEGAEGLLSFGIAGGLDPALKPGDVVVGSAVQWEGETYEADGVWKCRLLSGIAFSRSGIVAAVSRIAATPEAKRALYEGGASVVDMESGAMARVAARAGKPFAVLRAVADPADRGLPKSVFVGLAPDGSPRPWAVMGALLRRPWELPGLIRVGLDSRAALVALGDAVKVVGPSLGV